MNKLRLKAIKIANGDIAKAKEIEAYLSDKPESYSDTTQLMVGKNGNTGNRNNGDWNTGNWNTGNWNTGNRNTGNWNTGNRNNGDWNTGNWNTGNWNTGNWNTGNRNNGDWNTGDCNTGNRNTGDWNTTSFSNGFFNTEEVEFINVFDKPCLKSVWYKAEKPNCLYFTLTKWIDKSEMSDIEKKENPSYLCAGGYLKTYDYQEAFTKSVTEATKEDRDLIRALPNFDNQKFLEISGVDLSELDK